MRASALGGERWTQSWAGGTGSGTGGDAVWGQAHQPHLAVFISFQEGQETSVSGDYALLSSVWGLAICFSTWAGCSQASAPRSSWNMQLGSSA